MIESDNPSFSLEQYLSKGIETLTKDILRATQKHPAATTYYLRYARTAKKAASRRQRSEKNGEHVPSFIIASITGQCNLRCAGCYDHANHHCAENAKLRRDDWRRIFSEAEALGISVILLAGGEPLMRRDVLEEAALQPALLFPVFTNGTMLDDESIRLFSKHRNLIPIISIEGDQTRTDARRGDGIYARTMKTMDRLRERNLLFGASITVTSENLLDVTSMDTASSLLARGCKALVFVEYVPVESAELALDDAKRDVLERGVASLRERNEMIVISFPGDEKESGGCLAAGRGFFHINAIGGVEPCPFSPYSDTNLRSASLKTALQSPLFICLREEGALRMEHTGGCALFAQAEYVKELASNDK